MSDEIDELISELKDTKKLGSFLNTKPVKPTETPDVDEENINEFIMKTSSRLIQQGVDTIEEVKNAVIEGGTPEEVSAYSELIRAVSTSMDILNRINLQNKKDKTAKELKSMDIDNKKQLDQGPRVQTNNIILATREEMMGELIKSAEEKVINAEFAETPEPDEGPKPEKPE